MSIKSKIISLLSPEAKEDIKVILRKMGLYKPHVEQILLENFISSRHPIFLVQIGANDGMDFVGSVIRGFGSTQKLTSALVEPQLYFFKKLQEKYTNNPETKIYNFAISDKNDELLLYYLDYDNKTLPDWAKGLGSFDRNVLLSHRSLIPKIEDFIHDIKVKAVTAMHLVEAIEFPSIDVLVVDTEGHDFIIVSQFLRANIIPSIVIFESKHLTDTDLKSCIHMLRDRGYRTVDLYNDNTIAVRADALGAVPKYLIEQLQNDDVLVE